MLTKVGLIRKTQKVYSVTELVGIETHACLIGVNRDKSRTRWLKVKLVLV